MSTPHDDGNDTEDTTVSGGLDLPIHNRNANPEASPEKKCYYCKRDRQKVSWPSTAWCNVVIDIGIV